MKVSKFLVSTATTLAMVGAIGIAYAQTNTTDTTDSTNSPSSDSTNRMNDGSTRMDNTTRLNSDGTVDTRNNLSVDDGSATVTVDNDMDTMSGERVARYDRN